MKAEAWLSSQGEHRSHGPDFAAGDPSTRSPARKAADPAPAPGRSPAVAARARGQRRAGRASPCCSATRPREQRDEAIRQAQLAGVAGARRHIRPRRRPHPDPWEALRLAIGAQETSATPEATEALRSALRPTVRAPCSRFPTSSSAPPDSPATPAGVVTASYNRNGRRRILRWDLASGEPAPCRGPQPGELPPGAT